MALTIHKASVAAGNKSAAEAVFIRSLGVSGRFAFFTTSWEGLVTVRVRVDTKDNTMTILDNNNTALTSLPENDVTNSSTMAEAFDMLEDCAMRESRMTAKEQNIITSLSDYLDEHGVLTKKQLSLLEDLWDRITSKG